MEYENLKNWRQKKKEEFEADGDTNNVSLQRAERVDSISPIQSAPYQIFYSEDNNVEPRLKDSSLQEFQEPEESPAERVRATSLSATYSHPQRPKAVSLRSPNREEEGGYAYVYATADVDLNNKLSQSASQVPNTPTVPLSLLVEQPPNSTALIDDRRSGVSQVHMKDVGSPARRVSDSVVSIQHPAGHPMAKKSLSVSSGHGSSRFQTEPTFVSVKPLIMKMLPLYLCIDDGKVYADQNAASIPTHHLVEVKGLEKSIITKQLPPIPPPIISENDPLTRPNPVYETVPRDLAAHANKAAVIIDQPKKDSTPIQSLPSLPPENPPPRHSNVEPSTVSDSVAENVSNINNDPEKVITQGQVIAPTSTQATNLAHEQASLTDVIPPRRLSYTYRCYADDFSGQRLDNHEVHSYFYFTIVAAIVVGLCLNFVVLLAFFLPALWFANKASNSKHSGKTLEVRKYGRRALVLNIIGGVLHVLFIIVVAIVFITGVVVSLNN